MNLMNNERRVDSKRFTSYIDDSNFEIDLSTMQEYRRKLLEGEQMIHQSQNVILYEPLCNPKVSQGLTGLLTVTTFKLSFTPFGGVVEDVIEYSQKSNLLGPYEMCLSAIDTIYHVTGSTKKKLNPCHNVAGKIKELQIVCKNMRVLRFSFKNSDKDSGRRVTNTLLHHVYPKRHSLLFAYDFPAPTLLSSHPNGATTQGVKHKTRLFRSMDDWNGELQRTASSTNWRITLLNETFDPCPNLPRYLIVPKFVTDSHLAQSLRSFRNEGFPIWTWGMGETGVGLVRMAELLVGVTDRTQENTMLEKVRQSHPNKLAPEILSLDRDCPSPAHIRLGYLKLRELCTPSTYEQLRAQDSRFYSLLDGCRWLQYVCQCLKVALKGAQMLIGAPSDSRGEPTTVVLQEGNGHDMNCCISALIQIILDPYARTIYGFQSLLQKEWIAMGHPFSSRLGHVYSPSPSDSEVQSPLLLIFLDCVYQITLQFPLAFQYTSTYLCTVWDSAHLTAYETFLFNSEHERVLAEGDRGVVFRSVWEWTDQFPRQRDINMFCNPLYNDAATEPLVQFNAVVQCMEIWSQCYFRWLPGLEIRSGGSVHADVAMRFVVNEIDALHRQLQSATSATISACRKQQLTNGTTVGSTAEESGMLDYLSRVNSFFPFSVVDHRNKDDKDDSALIDNGVENQPDVDTQSQISS